jgi:hypothetical protein
MALVTRPPHVLAEGKEVKNLGWLLRHRNEVTYITLALRPDGTGRLYAQNGDAWLYQTIFQSCGIMVDFVDRPTWQGVPLRVLDFTDGGGDIEGGTVGDDAHRALVRKLYHR